MKLSSIHHAAIIVSDYEKSRDFYVNQLGFQVIWEHYRKRKMTGSWIYRWERERTLWNWRIFGEQNPPKRVNRPEACGLRHLAFRVESVEETARELEALGISCEPIWTDEYTQKKMTFFFDPDGLPLDLHE